MVKKRLIFTLLYKEGKFCLSRNFRKQFIGDKKWLFNNYNFAYVSKFIDELIILNVEDDRNNFDLFKENIEFILDNVFIPVTIGGGINSMETAKKYFNAGADKIIINSNLVNLPKMVNEIAAVYGRQAIVASIDYKNNKPYILNGKQEIDIDLPAYLKQIRELDIGELMLNSIERDGTGFGYDMETIKLLADQIDLPLIMSGGAGKKEHFLEASKINHVDAFSTANLLNFIGDALPNSRKFLLENGVCLADFKL